MKRVQLSMGVLAFGRDRQHAFRDAKSPRACPLLSKRNQTDASFNSISRRLQSLTLVWQTK